MERYSRQSVLPQIGVEGQNKIALTRAAIVGTGALGTVLAQLCARAGIGYLRLIDRDIVESSNLQRQVLFDENDVKTGAAKSTAAKKHLQIVNSDIQIEASVEDIHAGNITACLQGVHVILDGTDNFETRYLLNDYAVKNKVPFFYGGAVETRSMAYAVLPDGRPCLRCLFPEKPAAKDAQTCDRAGILASAAHITASAQFTQLIQYLTGHELPAELFHADIWTSDFKTIPAETFVQSRCGGCSRGEFPYLHGEEGIQTMKLCGRNAVQIQSEAGHGLDWSRLGQTWKNDAAVQMSEDFARISVPGYEMTLFKNGRAIIKGTEDPAVARSIYARWVGH